MKKDDTGGAPAPRPAESEHGGQCSANSVRADPWISYAELAAAARARRRSLNRLLRLLADSARLVWGTSRRLVLTNLGLQLASGIIVAVQVLATKTVLAEILTAERTGSSATRAVPAIIILAVITAFGSISSALLAQQSRLLSELTARTTWGRILDVAGSVDLLAYEGPSFFDQLRRVQTNAVTRPYLVVQGVIGIVGGLAGALGASVAILALQPLLLPLLLLGGVPLWYAGRRSSTSEFAFMVAQNEGVRKRAYLSSVLTGRNEAKELRAFGLINAIRQRYDADYDQYIASLRKHVGRKSRIVVLGNASAAVVTALTLLAIIWLVTRHEIGLAEAGAALVAIRMLSSQIAGTFGSIQQIFESGLFVEDLQRFVSLRPDIEESQRGIPAPLSFQRLVAEDLTFTYPGSGNAAVRGIGMEIEAGQVIALVGENGSGKTTLAKLLAGLYDSDNGSIRWDGRDIRECDRQSLRRSIAVIFQDFVRYQLTAAENIGAGRPEAMDDLESIVSAAEHAGADSFLAKLPLGYDTTLSRAFKGGMDLSGGEWQRVALARAFYRDASFVILDEPTAALDPRAEAELFTRIRELLAGRTVLLISHRFSSVRYADLIYVMKDGQIAEQGSHDELMARGGLYAELFTLQAAAYVDSPVR